jgi:hypothetical protein
MNFLKPDYSKEELEQIFKTCKTNMQVVELTKRIKYDILDCLRLQVALTFNDVKQAALHAIDQLDTHEN